MQNEIILAVQKEKVLIQTKRMHKYLCEANSVSADSSFKTIDEAFRSLYIAKGFYHTLHGMELLSEGNTVAEDIDRVEVKLNFIKEEKRRKHGLGWKGGKT